MHRVDRQLRLQLQVEPRQPVRRRSDRALLWLFSLGSKRRRRISARTTLLPERFAIIPLASLCTTSWSWLCVYERILPFLRVYMEARQRDIYKEETMNARWMHGQPRLPRIMANGTLYAQKDSVRAMCTQRYDVYRLSSWSRRAAHASRLCERPVTLHRVSHRGSRASFPRPVRDSFASDIGWLQSWKKSGGIDRKRGWRSTAEPCANERSFYKFLIIARDRVSRLILAKVKISTPVNRWQGRIKRGETSFVGRRIGSRIAMFVQHRSTSSRRSHRWIDRYSAPRRSSRINRFFPPRSWPFAAVYGL